MKIILKNLEEMQEYADKLDLQAGKEYEGEEAEKLLNTLKLLDEAEKKRCKDKLKFPDKNIEFDIELNGNIKNVKLRLGDGDFSKGASKFKNLDDINAKDTFTQADNEELDKILKKPIDYDKLLEGTLTAIVDVMELTGSPELYAFFGEFFKHSQDGWKALGELAKEVGEHGVLFVKEKHLDRQLEKIRDNKLYGLDKKDLEEYAKDFVDMQKPPIDEDKKIRAYFKKLEEITNQQEQIYKKEKSLMKKMADTKVTRKIMQEKSCFARDVKQNYNEAYNKEFAKTSEQLQKEKELLLPIYKKEHLAKFDLEKIQSHEYHLLKITEGFNEVEIYAKEFVKSEKQKNKELGLDRNNNFDEQEEINKKAKEIYLTQAKLKKEEDKLLKEIENIKLERKTLLREQRKELDTSDLIQNYDRKSTSLKNDKTANYYNDKVKKASTVTNNNLNKNNFKESTKEKKLERTINTKTITRKKSKSVEMTR